MKHQTVVCSKCGRKLLLDASRTIAVGGGATPQADLVDPAREREIMYPDCRVVTRFSDRDVVIDEVDRDTAS